VRHLYLATICGVIRPGLLYNKKNHLKYKNCGSIFKSYVIISFQIWNSDVIVKENYAISPVHIKLEH